MGFNRGGAPPTKYLRGFSTKSVDMLFELRQDGCGVALRGPPKCSSFSACWACRRSSRPPTPPAAAAEHLGRVVSTERSRDLIEQQVQRIGPDVCRARDGEAHPADPSWAAH
jgi:hypothetical protein